MGRTEVIKFQSAEALAAKTAADFVELVSLRKDESARFSVALSGGRISAKFFPEVVTQAKAGGVSFANVHFFWADERCVPPDDAESNFATANRLLLQPLNVPAGQVHRIRGEVNPRQAADMAERELLEIVPRNAAGIPALDLVLLGMGEDGHVASLFPDENEATRNDPALFRAVRASKPPPDRVTMGYEMLTAAKKNWVLVSGAGKAAVLERALSHFGQLPMGQVLTMREASRVYSDA